eukprot:CAMPEP_0118933968 /NCGR_PEP_ID=MMETSP1169-20130426/13141_1 /TAXON_ID=36882 /ORGANISM="Pyramimonas obovata, Strain CCMP722" /LENGTH=166 /DNA_ID=CAMNT_0006876811 /DNA_START=246 /DNA_END=746 /DNA_ORIENTATION=-
MDQPILATYKGRNARLKEASPSGRVEAYEPSPYDPISGLKAKAIDPRFAYAGKRTQEGVVDMLRVMDDHAVNVPISVSGMGSSDAPVKTIGNNASTTLSNRVIRRNKTENVRYQLETRERFEAPPSTALEIGFLPNDPKRPLHGRLKCNETAIEEHLILCGNLKKG